MKYANGSVRIGVSILALALVSCSQPSNTIVAERQPAEDGPSIPSPATTRGATTAEAMGRHWMQSDQLRSLMQGMSAKTERDWPNGAPQDPQDPAAGDLNKQFADAGRLADGLAAAAVRIPDSVAERSMSEADRAGFRAEADVLRDQAMRLGNAAHDRKIEQMRKSLDAISVTCLSCHSRYRDFAGQLDIQRAAADDVRGNIATDRTDRHGLSFWR